ncbi:hypothetical protein CEXT_656411 [Caerostris extrusa]|uniref:Uncharacterized protein n=1 Tax=Caerostris extrusa TaxID=172846 RepID=A0AAV4UG79_CAEEX|nr:hypothetical protein CEXT_656411 [Caerostris extrusa]
MAGLMAVITPSDCEVRLSARQAIWAKLEGNPTAGIPMADGLYKWVLMGEEEKCRAGFKDKRGKEPEKTLPQVTTSRSEDIPRRKKKQNKNSESAIRKDGKKTEDQKEEEEKSYMGWSIHSLGKGKISSREVTSGTAEVEMKESLNSCLLPRPRGYAYRSCRAERSLSRDDHSTPAVSVSPILPSIDGKGFCTLSRNGVDRMIEDALNALFVLMKHTDSFRGLSVSVICCS